MSLKCLIFFILIFKLTQQQDISTFRDPKKFKSFLKSHNNNFTEAADAMDKLVFEGKPSQAEELREVQKRLEKAERYVNKLQSAPSPTKAMLVDLFRLGFEIAENGFYFLKYIVDGFPVNMVMMTFISAGFTFIDQFLKMRKNMVEAIRYANRRKRYFERIGKVDELALEEVLGSEEGKNVENQDETEKVK